MKVIIAGCRTISDYSQVFNAMQLSRFVPTEIISGKANGVDRLGEIWAKGNKIPVMYFPADWSAHGKAAGPIRNKEMAKYADALVLIWDGKSKGSLSMLNLAVEHGLQVFVYTVSPTKHIHR